MTRVGYMTIHNTGDIDIDIVPKSLDTPRAARVSRHESMTQDGTMRMRALEEGLTTPVGGSVALKPLSYLVRPGGWTGVMTCFQTDDARLAHCHYRRDPTHVVFYR